MEYATSSGAVAGAFHQTRSQSAQSPRSGTMDWHSLLSSENVTGSSNGKNGNGNDKISGSASSGHQCRVCHRTYERADHLNRHLKSHENARPFQCSQCQKSFNRVDLLNRHVATHDRPSTGGKPLIRRTDRAGQACIACAAAKARCGDQKPCRRCETKGIKCETATQSQVASVRQSSTVPDSHASNPVQNSNAPESYQIQSDQLDANPFPATPLLYDIENHQRDTGVEINNQTYGVGSLPAHIAVPNLDYMTEEMLFFPNPSDFNNQNLDFGFIDFNFDDVQLDTAMMFPMDKPIGQELSNEPAKDIPARQEPNKQSVKTSSRSLHRDPSRAHAAFARSPWLWTPAHRDRLLNDQDNLTVDEEHIPSILTPGSSISIPGSQSDELPSIDSRLRDKMFSLICKINNPTHAMPNFPSLDILNNVIRAFFIRQSYQVENFIHVPTLSTAEAHPEFLLALVASGSTVISVPAVWKMGLVLQDVVRVTIGDLWERNNSNTRSLQPLQAFMLCLDTGIWGGFQRQMEIAESFGQPLVTMMRRGGILGAPLDTHALVPKESDESPALEVKWKKWSQRESFKRLVIRLFLHDTRASVALQKGALISFAELSFSLPAPRGLFLAGSAVEWKTLYLEHRTPQWRAPPRLLDALHDITILDDFHDECDISLCYIAILHGFWGQIWAYSESCKFHITGHNKSDSSHQLWLTTQHRELCRDIEDFQSSLQKASKHRPDLILTVELFLMVLHVSQEELQCFAGMGGEEAAVQVVPKLERWASTAHARKAVWHAGQVFRAATQMPPAGLRDFFAIAVYFASLTLWTYSNLCPSSSRNGSERPKSRLSHLQDTTLVAVVDGPETRETRAFISGNLDAPALTAVQAIEPIPEGFGGGNVTTVRLSEPNAALKIARDLYRGNFPVMDGPLPPLVENMGNLMRDLSSLPDSRFSRCVSPVDR